MSLTYWPVYLILSLSQIFVTGWGIYSLTANQKVIMQWISEVYQDSYHQNQFSDRVTLIFSILNSINGIGSILGAILVMPLSDKYGRKVVLLISTLCNIVYTLLFFIAKPTNSIISLIIGRLIIGIPLALQSNVLVYLNEITSIPRRGLVMSLGVFWFVLGFLVQNLLALEVVFGTTETWNYVQLFSIVFLLPEIFCFKWIPESIGFWHNLGELDQVKRIVKSLYGTNDTTQLDLDFDQKLDASQNIATTRTSWTELWSNKTLLKCTIFVLIYCIFDMSTGVLTISFYSTELIRSFDFDTLTSQLFTLLFTFLRVLASLLGSWLTKKIKRKLNLQISILGILFFNAILFGLGFIAPSENISGKNLVKIFELICVNGMSIFFNLGVHAIYFVLPEIIPTQYKMLVLRVWALASNITMLIHIFMFPLALKKIGHFAFAIFMVLNGMFLAWVQFRYVESKDIASEQVFKKFETRRYI